MEKALKAMYINTNIDILQMHDITAVLQYFYIILLIGFSASLCNKDYYFSLLATLYNKYYSDNTVILQITRICEFLLL